MKSPAVKLIDPKTGTEMPAIPVADLEVVAKATRRQFSAKYTSCSSWLRWIAALPHVTEKTRFGGGGRVRNSLGCIPCHHGNPTCHTPLPNSPRGRRCAYLGPWPHRVSVHVPRLSSAPITPSSETATVTLSRAPSLGHAGSLQSECVPPPNTPQAAWAARSRLDFEGGGPTTLPRIVKPPHDDGLVRQAESGQSKLELNIVDAHPIAVGKTDGPDDTIIVDERAVFAVPVNQPKSGMLTLDRRVDATYRGLCDHDLVALFFNR